MTNGSRIIRDHSRYKNIVRQKIRENLQRYISNEELVGRKGNDIVRIPIPRIDIPRFRYGSNETGGVGMGDGDEGDPVDPSQVEPNRSGGGHKEYSETEISLEELTDMLIEELGLPDLKPTGIKNIEQKSEGLRSVGRKGVKTHFRRTYKEALKRSISTGIYNPDDPQIIFNEYDFRKKVHRIKPKPNTDAVLIGILDISGSMEEERLTLVKQCNFWLEQIIERVHPKTAWHYILHDTEAYIVNEHQFYHAESGGGTEISSGLKKCIEIMNTLPAGTNIYPVYYSDGNTTSNIDEFTGLELLKNDILPRVNAFFYGEAAPIVHGSTQFSRSLDKYFTWKTDEKLKALYRRMRIASLNDRSDLLPALGIFLNKDNKPFYRIE